MPIFAAFVIIVSLYAQPCFSFSIPEKLVYELTWTGLTVGTASLEVTSENDQIRIVSTARSADWVSIFHNVKDRIESVVALADKNPGGMGTVRHYDVKINEGRYHRDKEVLFDHEKKTAYLNDRLNNEKKEYPIEPGVYDPLSSFYYLRTMKLEEGKSVYISVFDSKKTWDLEIRVLKREKISTKIGEFDAIMIEPLMQSEGIFSRKGKMYIWLSDDDRHIPLMMQTKVSLGKVTATLVSGQY